MGWQDRIPFIQDGQNVSAGVTNSAPETIDQNTRYLNTLIQALQLGSAIFARNQPVSSACNVGMPVFYNSSTQEFEPALAGTQTDSASQLLVPTPASYVAGIVFQKLTATSADLLVMGLVNSIDLSAAITDAVPSGLYHLSTSKPGGLVSNSPPASVPVLWVWGSQVLVVPQIPDFLTGHQHYKFQLAAQPASTSVSPPGMGDRHIITSADSALPGWLPADDPSFNGLAPAGAYFGYNLAEDPALQNLWPPVPLASVILTRTSGTSGDFLGQVPAELVQFDANGIWWMSDCYGEVPWPTDFTTGVSISESEPYSHCPVAFAFTLDLWFTKLDFLTSTSTVTSLRSASSALEITCLSTGLPAAVGDLLLTLNLGFLIGQTNLTGYSVIKQLADQTFGFGPIVEGIYASGNNITLSGSTSRHLVPSDSSSPTLWQGAVEISVSTDPSMEVPIELVRLDGVKEVTYQGVLYLGFVAGVQGTILGKIRIPKDLSIASPVAVLQAYLLGRSGGTLPDLTVTYQVEPAPPAGLGTPVNLVTTPTSLTMPTSASVGANQYVEAVSNSFSVAAGDLVFFTIQRSGSDGYAGELGILDLSCLLAGG